MIAVLAGVDTAPHRKAEGERVLEYGFREFQEYALFSRVQPVAEADVWLGVLPKVPLVAKDTVAITLSRDARKGLVVKLAYDSPVSAPVGCRAGTGPCPRSPHLACRR